ncbi:hypothetical protein B0T16DRAFT_416277 [Cercophora newfieldiana]|uniref:NOT2/NOT3/NOT5 C-terminal domain-containing protein n=1 Tax=Cercophora newfieldiana TaxID=92897 RepID=A0AA40CM94_9PEZI|nr:hypothetical protein B0T16DRAFT_416277 [Cercophora newfieldiana]
MMNRPGTGPQSHRMPAGFGNQQQPQQSGRAVANRLQNGKLGSVNSAPGWGFGGGMPMSSASVQPSARQLSGVSFAQSLGSGSQPPTPLDPSEFPSLSNTSQMGSSNPASMWSASGSRSLASSSRGGAGLSLSSQQNQQDDFFSSGRLPSGQGSFRFGSQAGVTPSSQTQPSGSDEFPPLNRNVNGEIGGQRDAALLSNLSFGSQAAASTIHGARAGNGLLNALSQNSRASEVRPPSTIARPQDPRSPAIDDDPRQKPAGYREDSLASHSSIGDGSAQLSANRNPLGAIGNDPPTGKMREEEKGRPNDGPDPLEGMAAGDKWGLKGLRTLMNNYPDYNALTCGIDPSNLGLNLSGSEPISDKVFSLFEDDLPRPAVAKYRIPECYKVGNVQPIEAKIQSFNEETLMWIFYSCTGDIKQHLAAIELNNRNWRWHKKLRIWLTKDEMMVPQALSSTHERGYYIVWDTGLWHKERREFTLYYADLEPNPTGNLLSQIPGGAI